MEEGSRDNLYGGNLPALTGMVQVLAQGEEPVELFSSLFPDTLIDEITFQSNMFALQQGKGNLNLSPAELKGFLGINLTMDVLVLQSWPSPAFHCRSSACQ